MLREREGGGWLYASGVELPELRWGFVPDTEGLRTRGPWGGIDGWRDSFRGQGALTPLAFRDVLLAMARTAGRVPA